MNQKPYAERRDELLAMLADAMAHHDNDVFSRQAKHAACALNIARELGQLFDSEFPERNTP